MILNHGLIRSGFFRVGAQHVGSAIFKIFNRLSAWQYPIVRVTYGSLTFLHKRWIEDSLHRLLIHHPTLLSDGTVFDVGGATGYTTHCFLKHSKVSSVHLFEPSKVNFSIAREMLKLFGAEDRTTFNKKAVGNRNSTVKLQCSALSHADNWVELREAVSEEDGSKVEMCTLDSYWQTAQPVAAIKIDVQGFELSVLQGAARIIQDNKDIVVIFELSPRDLTRFTCAAEDIFAYFQAFGFLLYKIENRGKILRQLSGDDKIEQILGGLDYVDLVATRRRLN